MAAPVSTSAAEAGQDQTTAAPESTPKKKGRTNTPWTAEEEQRLKSMRDAGRSWSEIAKVRIRASNMHYACILANLIQTFPSRTEGSVKKHWYKVRISPISMPGWVLNVSGHALRRIRRR